MSRGKLWAALAIVASLAYTVALVAGAIAKSSTPTDASALRYERQQVSSFAAEGALLAGEVAAKTSWDQFRRGGGDMLLQQTSSLAQQLKGEQFTPQVAKQGHQLAALATQIARLLERLSRQNVSATQARVLKAELQRLAREAGGLR